MAPLKMLLTRPEPRGNVRAKYLTVHPENCDPVRHLVDPTVVN